MEAAKKIKTQIIECDNGLEKKENLKFMPQNFYESLNSSDESENIMKTDRTKEELKEWNESIRIDRFEKILPTIMKKHGIDMFVYVMRLANQSNAHSDDPLAGEFGANSGVYIFTDLGDKLEKVVFDYVDKDIASCGAYDKVFKPSRRITLDEFFQTIGNEYIGEAKTELDYRFEGVSEYIKEHDPKVIALNYWEKLGGPIEFEPGLRYDGISLTDYNILTKKIGLELSSRIVSAEYMIFDYIATPSEREIEYCKLIREDIIKLKTELVSKIIPGVTKVNEIGAFFRKGYRKNGDFFEDEDVFKPGDFFSLAAGLQSPYEDFSWPYGNTCEVEFDYYYILDENEDEMPKSLQDAWNHHLKVRKIIDKVVKPGFTALEVLETMEEKLEEAGYKFCKEQDFNFNDERVQIPVDMHAAGKGFYAPRLGYMGPKWMREMILPENHHYFNEFWIYTKIDDWKDNTFLSLQFHDGAFANENGAYYPAPFPDKVTIIK